jgi:hypothetical protein
MHARSIPTWMKIRAAGKGDTFSIHIHLRYRLLSVGKCVCPLFPGRRDND